MNVASETGGGVVAVRTGTARFLFAVLFAMSLLDWIDRWTLTGVLPVLQKDLGIGDAEAGSLSAFFLISYCVVSPVMGYLGDRVKRTRLLAVGVGVWSLATIGTGLAQDLGHLRLARSVLGIGEATYGVLAPAMLMDVFDRSRRARVLSLFYMAMPIGYVLGLTIGGTIAERTGSWRLPFFIVGLPGLLAAVAALWFPDPVRGQSEGYDLERLKADERVPATAADWRDLAVNSSYTYTVFGLAAYTFAFGGLAYWLPSFLQRARGIPAEQALLMVGLTGLFAALIGMSAGGWAADRLSRKNPAALFLVSGTSMLLAVPCIVAGLAVTNTVGIVVFLFLAQALMFANTGPANAVIANVVLPKMRAAAYAINTFFIHMLGDVWSPWLMGTVSDEFGKPSMAATPVGAALAAIGFGPVELDGRATNLGAGMLVVVPAVLLGGGVLLAGMRHLPREMALMQARLRAELARVPAGAPAAGEAGPAMDPR
jgi:MFS family permease